MNPESHPLKTRSLSTPRAGLWLAASLVLTPAVDHAAPIRGLYSTGVNTVDFTVNNSAVGYTALRLDPLRLGALRGAGCALRIASQPRGSTVLAGATVRLTVVADGCPPLGYQWKRDGTDLPGATQATLELAAVTGNHTGDYTDPNPTGLRIDGLRADGLKGMAAPPMLAIARSGADLRVTWPSSATGFKLHSTSSLAPPAWSEVNAPVKIEGALNVVTITPGLAPAFYRLQQ